MLHRHQGTAGRKGLGELVGLPEAQPFEAPSSWITRAALSQGISPRELLIFMGFGAEQLRCGDPDMLLTSPIGQKALRAAGHVASMPIAERVFASLRIINPKADALLREAPVRARCRYCPICLRYQRNPHLEAHCRFSPWRFCPLHGCLMEDLCPHCGQMVLLPFDMRTAGPKRRGVASLSECQRCGDKLYEVEPVWLRSLTIESFDRMRLSNGRALMAALYSGKVTLGDGKLIGWLTTITLAG